MVVPPIYLVAFVTLACFVTINFGKEQPNEGSCPFAKNEDKTKNCPFSPSKKLTAAESSCLRNCQTRCSAKHNYGNEKDQLIISYSFTRIHEIMIKDRVRTNTYYKAIMDNPHLFQGKTVLEVGSGTGILSLFAAKAGAKRVIGIEASSLVDLSRQVIKDNNLSDVITIVHGKVEEVELPDGIDKVDVIISEIMGYCLLYENVIPTLLFARDKWLRPGGVMFPDRFSLHLTAAEDALTKQDAFLWWENVYGFNMSVFGPYGMFEEHTIMVVDKEKIVTTSTPLQVFDLYTVTEDQLSFSVPFSLTAKRADYVHALVAYFEVDFLRCTEPVTLTTSPLSVPTHWKQTVFYLKDFLVVRYGEEITGQFSLAPVGRGLIVDISVSFNGKLSALNETNTYRV